MNARAPRSIVAAVLAALATLLAGCGTLPDARPFADATSSWASSVGASGRALADSMVDAGSVVPSDAGAYERIATNFNAAWRLRVAAAQAAAAYSDAIAELIDAGQNGGEAAAAVSDSLGALAGAIGISAAAPALGVASDIGRIVFQQIAAVRASRGLEEAVVRAQPAVDRIAELIVDDASQQLAPILKELYANVASGIKGAYDADEQFSKRFKEKRTERRQLALNDASKLAELQEFDRTQATVALALHERDDRLDRAAAAYKARLRLVAAMADATRAWAQAHRDLAAAIAQKRRVDVAGLQQAVGELRVLITRVSEL